MKKLYSTLPILATIIAVLSFTACGSNDEDEIMSSPDSYIVGTWRSFKGEVFYNGEKTVLDIDKTGANSGSYMEIKFENGNKVTAWWWAQDNNNISHWTEGTGTYLIKGTVVTITDTNGDTMDLLYDSKDRTLMLRSTPVVDGNLIPASFTPTAPNSYRALVCCATSPAVICLI